MGVVPIVNENDTISVSVGINYHLHLTQFDTNFIWMLGNSLW